MGKQINSIREMTFNPYNTPIIAIPKRQVFSRRKVRIQFYINSSLNKGYSYSYSYSNEIAK